jgi:hypothetical protein
MKGDEHQAGLERAPDIVKIEETTTAPARATAAEPAALERVAEAEAQGDGGDHGAQSGRPAVRATKLIEGEPTDSTVVGPEALGWMRSPELAATLLVHWAGGSGVRLGKEGHQK